MDRLNERAVEQIGDALLFFEDGYWVIAEDYIDEVEYILTHSDYALTAIIEAMPTETSILQETSRAFEELEESWADFAQNLQTQHWEGLAALLAGEDLLTRLEAIARTMNSTANQLVDDLNGFALDTIGDIIIDTSKSSPFIEDEDKQGIQALVKWAMANAVAQ
jgi:hypothetical protein